MFLLVLPYRVNLVFLFKLAAKLQRIFEICKSFFVKNGIKFAYMQKKY